MNAPTRNLKKNGFTLIEIVLALMVAAVGIIGVMALFPVGLSKNKETVSSRSAADAADQFLHSMAARIRADWNTTHAFPDFIPTMSEDRVVWSEATLLQNSNVTINFSAVNASDSFNPMTHQDGLFKVTQITPSNIVDFKGVIRAWKEMTEIGDSRLTGDIVPFGLMDTSNGTDGIAFGYENGRDYILKDNAQGGPSPGNYGALALGGSGAATYKNNIINGYSDVSVGQTISSEPGNMAGPTVDGVNTRLAATPYVRVPVVTPFTNGRNSVTVLGFLAFELKQCVGHGNDAAEVHATYIGPDASGAGMGSSSYKLTLKAEVSWPYDLPYASRQKEIYSVKLFKGGTIASFATPGEEPPVVVVPPVAVIEPPVGEDLPPVVVVPVPTGNTAPVAVAQTLICAKKATIGISLFGTDADGDVLTYTLVSGPSSGTLTGTAPNFTFNAPAGNYSTSLTFKCNDGHVDSNIATITISP